MNSLLFFVLGVLVAGIQGQLAQDGIPAPWLAPLFFSVIASRSPVPGLASRLLGFALGLQAVSIDPLGVQLLGVGLVALVIVPLRDLVYVEQLPVQCLLALVACILLGSCRLLAASLGAAPWLGGQEISAIGALMSTATAPILHLAWEGMDRMFPGLHLQVHGPGRDLFAGSR